MSDKPIHHTHKAKGRRLDDKARERLVAVADPAHRVGPPLRQVIEDTREVVPWLRSRLTYKNSITEGMPSGPGSIDPPPPMNLTVLDQADAEARALAHWCKYFGLNPTQLSAPYWSTRGEMYGLESSGDTTIVGFMAAFLVVQLEEHPEPEGMYEGPQGLWSLRRETYNMFPELEARLITDVSVTKVVEQIGLW